MGLQSIEDADVRAIFEEGEAAGFLRFRYVQATAVSTYYSFQWRDRFGRWQDGMLTGSEILAHFGSRM
jgi:hypothetical protein